jgi:hypothetical protein
VALKDDKDRVRDRLLEGLEWARREMTKFLHLGKLKYDTTSLQRERTQIYEELGRVTVDLVKRGALAPEPLKPMVERIDQLTARIEERKSAMKSLVRAANDANPPVQI